MFGCVLLTHEQELHFRIRWPYDVVTDANEKLCGIINESHQSYEESYAVIGMGLHVNNSNANCLKKQIKSDTLLSRSFILSKYLFVFSTLLRSFSEFGFEAISSLYLRYWMHTDSVIKVTGTDGNACSVTLKGITDDGYLKGQDQLHRWVELYPDHNCEDSLANMIAHFP